MNDSSASGVARPQSAPVARNIHAFILLATSGLTVLVTAVLGPSLVKMQQHFVGTPGADYLVPMSLTVPMAVMAIFSVFAGALSDRVGRKILLVAATALYAVVGTAPLWLDSLAAILVSRVLIGVCEGVLMPLSTSMIGDYFSGARREKLMALQTTFSAAAAIVFNSIGGLLGEHGWRAPYVVYFVSLILAPLMFMYLWEPVQRGQHATHHAPHHAPQPGEVQKLNRPLLAIICAVGFLGGLAFLIVPIHLSYLMKAIGVTSSSMVGGAAAMNSVAVMAGTLLFGWVIAPRLTVGYQLALCGAFAGVGFMLMGVATTYTALSIAVIINGLGCGVLLPTVVTWNMRSVPVALRGFGVGIFQSALFFGMFINPVLIVYTAKTTGSWATTFNIVGLLFLVLGALALLFGRQPRTRSAQQLSDIQA